MIEESGLDMDTNMSDAQRRLKEWFSKAANWQKDLFINIWNGGKTEEEHLNRTIKLIGQEYLSENHRLTAAMKFPDDITFVDDKNHSVKLVSISDVKGVGALAPLKPLSFSDGLTVVYGNNGCGKSSYVRILKAAANPVNSNAVFGNVFQTNNVSPEAKIMLSVDGEESSYVWNKMTKKQQPIQIYDTVEADRFVNQKNEIIYEPRVLRAITQMVGIYDHVTAHFAEIDKVLECEMAQSAQSFCSHSLVLEFNGLSTQKQLDSFVKKYTWTEKLREELGTIATSLKESNPMQAAKAKEAQREAIRNHGYTILKLLVFVSDEARVEYLKKRERQIVSKNNADQLVHASKDQSLLDEFGSDIWKAMWARAIAYVRTIEGEAVLPLTEAGRCALCQQELDTEALDRMQAFKTFYESSAIKEANVAYRDFETAVKGLQDNVENKVNIAEIQNELEARSISEDIQNEILSLYERILARCNWLLSYCDDTNTEIPYMQNEHEITSIFKEIVDKITLEINTLHQVAADSEKLENRMYELQAIQWVHVNLARKKRRIVLKTICSKCKTNLLTTLKKDLSQLLITDAYIQKFQEEMNALDARRQIKVELVAVSPSKGRSYHQVSLKGACSVGKHRNNEILSEGEFRVVSLASFLTDLSSWHRNMPFIFDDPITSLDHRYESSVARRLIQLSTERQVIVFTHRLAFAQLLESACTEFNTEAAHNNKPVRACTTHIELRDSPLGQPSKPTYVGKLKIDSAVSNLLNQDIAQTKRLQHEGEFELADATILSICTTFRNVVEYGIEHDLLSGVVSRFDRNVSTQKLRYLKVITEADISLFERMMSKYSYYDHSHSVETPFSLPEIEDLEKDLLEMKAWAEAFKKRTKKV